MEIEQFERLSNLEKDELISGKGIFFGNYDEGNDMCDVYQLYDFYVAFCYELDKDTEPEISAHVNADELPLLFNSKKAK